MGKSRVCGGACHNAKGAKCRCWCGGLFHGAAGQGARDAFRREMGVDDLPTTQEAFDNLTAQPDLFSGAEVTDRWRNAVAAAVAARTGHHDADATV